MTEAASVPSVALLFADADLGAQLREALQASGARIVHEGAPADVTRAHLKESGADVVIVNLDESDDNQVEHLYDVIDEDRQRVIFNDAAASRALTGWDRARWARHLAVKVMGSGDVDPPRPAAAAAVELPSMDQGDAAGVADAPGTAPIDAEPIDAEPIVAEPIVAEPPPLSEVQWPDLPMAVDLPMDELDHVGTMEPVAPMPPTEAESGAQTPGASDADLPLDADDEASIAAMTQMWEDNAAADAELAVRGDDEVGVDAGDADVHALLQQFDAANIPAAAQLPGAGARDAGAGDFSDFSVAGETDSAADAGAAAGAQDAFNAAFGEDDPAAASDFAEAAPTLLPEPMDASADGSVHVPASAAATGAVDITSDGLPAMASIIERQTQSSLPPVEDWDLVDFDANADKQAAVGQRENSKTFGIEKVHAEDYLAPHTEEGESPLEPGMTLELVSLEESLAHGEHGGDRSGVAHEMFLDASSTAIRRLVVLATAPEGAGAVREVVAALAPPLPALLVLVQHHKADATEAIAEQLKAATQLGVRVMQDGQRARIGELLVLPAGHRCQIARDGRVQMQAVGARDQSDPSIDDCLISACSTFGADLRALIFAGDANDALAGAQAVYDRRGHIWVQDPVTCAANAMVTMAIEDGVVEFVGSPGALAKRLQEVLA